MLFVLLSWVFAFTIFFSIGCLLQKKILKELPENLLYFLLNGMFLYMLIVWSVLYFVGFKIYFQIVAFFLSLLLLKKLHKNCDIYKILLNYLKNLNFYQRILLFIIILLILLLSSIGGILPDNDTYYIQTIKWANEQGFVKGLMNLHPFLGQFSGWHILQAGINLLRVNSLNGFLFFIFIIFVILDIQDIFPFWLKITGIFSAVFIFFISDPSPDLAVWLLSLLIFDLFIKNFARSNEGNLMQISLLVFFALLIKITAVMNLFLLLILLNKHKDITIKISKFLIGLSLLTSIFWLTKNYINNGYLFYPLNVFVNLIHPQWQYPQELLLYMKELGQKESFALTMNKNIFNSFQNWLFLGNLIKKSINQFTLFLLIIFPLIIWFKRKKIPNYFSYLVVYRIGLVYFIIILFLIPNFRFYAFFLIFVFLVLIEVILSKKWQKIFYFFSIALLIFAICFLLKTNLNYINKNQFIINSISNLSKNYSEYKEGNLKYNSLNSKEYFWQTGDGSLPTSNYFMIKFFKKNFYYIPQSNKEGYYMKKLK